ncbi:putative mannose-6-phosphate isomerase [Taenia crassiceps]|uniref:Mannose-6-phosphate isomerase n=1 Tax=Taenia crassiceps TaxID=6207 RepID=A0ABR4Q509_9CEST
MVNLGAIFSLGFVAAVEAAVAANVFAILYLGVDCGSVLAPLTRRIRDSGDFDTESRGFSLPPVPTASILLIFHGHGIVTCPCAEGNCLQEAKFGPGFVYFVPADMIVNLISERDRRGSLHAFRAYVNRQ